MVVAGADGSGASAHRRVAVTNSVFVGHPVDGRSGLAENRDNGAPSGRSELFVANRVSCLPQARRNSPASRFARCSGITLAL